MSDQAIPDQPGTDQVLAELDLDRPLVVGFGVTSQAVVRALLARGIRPTIVDDRPSDASVARANEFGVELLVAPSEDLLSTVVSEASVLLPSPGVPDHHPVFALARQAKLVVASEFDLAQQWDSRPLLAVTGTNGKTSVTMMVTDALERSGVRAAAVGNTEVPLVEAIADPEIDVFVVEASSFRLDHSHAFAPRAAVWLNFSPDHLDAHASLECYEAAKAAIWAHQSVDSVAVVNQGDAVVNAHRPDTGIVATFGAVDSDWYIADGELRGPNSFSITVSSLPRRQPHDLQNAAAAAALAIAGGATHDGVQAMLRSFAGLPHRVDLVGESQGVRWFNDSKATVPHATLAAVGGFSSVVLIAGGRNKGLDLDILASAAPPVKSVVAIGESAEQIGSVFAGLVPVQMATNMQEAVTTAADLATEGDVVLLSPACTSFDWYSSYKERGLDFASLVAKHVGR